MAEEGATKRSLAEKIEILLDFDRIVRPAGQRLANFRRTVSQAIAELRFADALQPLGGNALGELMKIKGLVVLFEMLVEQVRVGFIAQHLRLFLERVGVDALRK